MDTLASAGCGVMGCSWSSTLSPAGRPFIWILTSRCHVEHMRWQLTVRGVGSGSSERIVPPVPRGCHMWHEGTEEVLPARHVGAQA